MTNGRRCFLVTRSPSMLPVTQIEYRKSYMSEIYYSGIRDSLNDDITAISLRKPENEVLSATFSHNYICLLFPVLCLFYYLFRTLYLSHCCISPHPTPPTLSVYCSARTASSQNPTLTSQQSFADSDRRREADKATSAQPPGLNQLRALTVGA